MIHPRIGITTDNEPDADAPGRYRLSAAYTIPVAAAGGLPLLLPQEPDLAEHYVDLCDAIMLTGGRDAATDAFGQPIHPDARLVEPSRQEFEQAMLDAVSHRPEMPVLGICLGMQMMALHAGGRLDTSLAETLGAAAADAHRNDRTHRIEIKLHDSVLFEDVDNPDSSAPPGLTMTSPPGLNNFAPVASSHRQAVADPGPLRLVATAPDGTIEAIDYPQHERRYYLGVQWHPERGGQGYFNLGLIQRFVGAARATMSAKSP